MVQWYGAYRPAVMGAQAMVSSTHYLATSAGVESGPSRFHGTRGRSLAVTRQMRPRT